MTRGRRGFTLVELIVVTVLSSLVGMAALQVLITNQRTFTAQSATISGQQSTRMALEILFNELREVSPSGGDILAMSSDSIRVRLMRKFSFVCETDHSGMGVGNFRVVVLNLPGRKFEDGDSVFVFADNDPNRDDDDAWIIANVTAVDTMRTCPQDGARATELRFNGQAALFSADSVGLGSPVRSYRPFTFGLTTLLGDPYLGRRERAAAMTPIAGPLRASTGLEFVYRDALGAVTAVPTDVRQIVVGVRTGSGVLNSLGQEVSDSITAWVHTRN